MGSDAGSSEVELVGGLDLLDEVVVRRVADRIVARAREIAGCPVDLYVVDLDGRRLRRAAGESRLPDEIPLGRRLIGPEISADQIVDLGDDLPEGLPPACLAPLWLRGRAIALLLCEREPRESLRGFARGAAAAVELAEAYTDVFASARRARATSAAAEIQQLLMPPRIVRVDGAEIAGTIMPAYSVGGDWFDHCATHDAVWLAVADAVGKGPRAAALSAVALGAYRAARRSHRSLPAAAREIHETVLALGAPASYTTALLASWTPSRRTFSWIRCGHPHPLLCHQDGQIEVLQGGDGPPLGIAGIDPVTQPAERQLEPEQRIILLSDGVTERRLANGDLFGHEGVARTLAAASTSASETVATLLDAVANAHHDPPRDDATVLVLRATDEPTDPARS